MNPGPFAAIAPGAASQLSALLAAVAGGALVAGLVWLLPRFWRRGPDDRAASNGGARAGAPPPRPGTSRRLLGGVLLLVLVVPTAAALRQLWPHPALGARLLLVWLPLVLVPTLFWLLGGRDAGGGRSGP